MTVTLPLVILDSLSKSFSDEAFIKHKYKILFGKRINLLTPITFNEKLNWLKLNDRNPQYTLMADKYEAKRYVSERIGGEFLVDNYGVYDKWDNIEFSKLPNQFVIKCTHDSSGVSICKDKSTFDFEAARLKIERSYRRNYYWNCREWPYKDIKPRIIIDRFLDDHTGNELRDYKFWCFNGVPQYMYCTVKAKQIYENFYDMDFKPVPVDHGFPRHNPEFEKPANLS